MYTIEHKESTVEVEGGLVHVTEIDWDNLDWKDLDT
jgi:hypothetical protein